MFGPLLAQMPPAAMVGLAALLLSLTLWVAWRALRDLLVVRAVYGTPETRQQSAFSASRVKVRGLARAAPLQKDPGQGQVIWQESTRYSGGGFRSGTETYGDLLIESGDVLYAVRSQGRPARSYGEQEEHAFLDRSTFSITRTLRSGDALWAIGRPERGAIADSGEARKTFRLRRSARVLLVSGATGTRGHGDLRAVAPRYTPPLHSRAAACSHGPCSDTSTPIPLRRRGAADVRTHTRRGAIYGRAGRQSPGLGQHPSTGTSCASEGVPR
jgi:hypothetical protein